MSAETRAYAALAETDTYDEFERRVTSMSVPELFVRVPPGHRTEPWTWDDEEADVRSRLCLCCGQPGHFQQTVEELIATGALAATVCIGEDGRLHDGHHRAIAAKTLGIERVALETMDEANSRWANDHGHCVWELRQFGDVHPGEAWAYVQNFRQAARDFVARESLAARIGTVCAQPQQQSQKQQLSPVPEQERNSE